jgi:hypothetical protein
MNVFVRRAMAPALVSALMVPGVAHAQGRDPGAATELFEQGRALAGQGDYAAACPKFADSEQLDPKVGTLLNLADCEERLGRLVSARTHLQQAADLARRVGDDRADYATQRFSALDPRVAKLTVRLRPDAPSGLVVTRDDVPLGQGSLGTSLPIDPGTHTVVVSGAGYDSKSYSVLLKDGQVQDLVVEPGPKTASPDGTQAPSWGTQKTLAVAAASVGVIGVGIGSVFGLVAKSKFDQSNSDGAKYCDASGCTPDGITLRHTAVGLGNASTIAFVVGGAALAAGVVLWITAPRASASPRAPGDVAIGVGPSSVHLVGTF